MRPTLVTLLAVAVFTLSAGGVFTVAVGVGRYALFLEVGAGSLLALRIVMAAVWAGVWAGFGVGLWRLKPWARRWLPAACAAYGLTLVLTRSAVALSPYAQGRWPFLVLVGGVGTALITLIVTRPAIIRAFEPQQITQGESNP